MSQTSEVSRAAKLGFWVRRYLPAELVGTGLLLCGGWATAVLTRDNYLATLVSVCCESLGFYAILGRQVYQEQRKFLLGGQSKLQLLRRTLGLLAAECGPAEVLDSFLIRPALLFIALQNIANPALALLVGKLVSDLAFYLLAGLAYQVTVKTQIRVPKTATSMATLRQQRCEELESWLAQPKIKEVISAQDTPFLVLDPERVREQYRELNAHFPMIKFHYAVKALDHPVVLKTLAELGAGFDVATRAELEKVTLLKVPAERIIYTHPIKTTTEIEAGLAAGIRVFVVDNPTELAKFLPYRGQVSLLIRLSFPNTEAQLDLSKKFGVPVADAENLLAKAISLDLWVAGFSFHVGSQLNNPNRFKSAITTTLAAMETWENRFEVRFEILDIGGGFPVSYQNSVSQISELAAAIVPTLLEKAADLDVIAEPGRILVADAMTLVTSVVGVSDRADGRWYYLDDGVYGSYSNVLTEKITPLVITEAELAKVNLPKQQATLAGPTCDSVDVITQQQVPELVVGSRLFSPTMGAYTTVTATEFNGIPKTPVVVCDSQVFRFSTDKLVKAG